MQASTIVSLIVNVLFVLILALGALSGLKRGVKRASLRIGFFIVFAIIGAVISPYITEALLGINFNWPNGMRGSILSFFENQIKSTEEISNLINKNPSIVSLLKQLIIVVCNFLVFIVLAFIMKFISWIGFKITAKYVLKDKKKKQTLEEIKKNTTNTFDLAPKPEKKYRLWGSLVGLAQGFVFAFIVFLPISGIVSTVNSVFETASVEGEGTPSVVTSVIDEGEEEKSELPATIGDFLKENVPVEIYDCIKSYKKSAIGLVGGVGDFDATCFDTISTLKVKKQKVTLRKEILNVCALYEDFVYVYNFDWQNGKLKTLDFETVDGLVDKAFNLDLVDIVIGDLVPYFLNNSIVNDETRTFGDFTAEVKDGAKSFCNALTSANNTSGEIKNDLRAIYNIAKLAAKDGIIDEIRSDGFKIGSVLNSLTVAKEGGTIMDQAIDQLMSTDSLRVVLNTGMNVGLEAFNKQFETTINVISYKKENWETAATEAKAFADNLSSIYTYYNSLAEEKKNAIGTFDFDDAMMTALKGVDLDKLITPLGKALDILNNSKLLNTKQNNIPVMDTIISTLSSSDKLDQVADYIDLAVANDENFKFETAFSSMCATIEKLIDYDILSEVASSDFDATNLVEKFKEDPADEAYVPLTFDDTFGKLIDSKIFRPSFIYAFNALNGAIEEVLETEVEVGEISKDTDIVSQKEDIKSFFNNLLPLTDAFLTEGDFDIDNIDFDALEKLLEGMKINVYATNGTLKTGAVLQGTYINLIEYLKNIEEYGEYFEEYYDSYANPYEVEWSDLFDAVESAIDLKESGKITPDNLSDIIELAGRSEAITGVVKDALKDAVGSDNTELNTKIDNLDLSDDSTQELVTEVAVMAGELQKLADGDKPRIEDEADRFIDILDDCENQDSVNAIIDIVDTVAADSISANANSISGTEKDSIKNKIEGAENLDDETKAKLKDLFGITGV